jgi:hypothetical protein
MSLRTVLLLLAAIVILTVVPGRMQRTIVQDRDVLTVAAAGFIPLAIGVGFFIDYNLQKRELSRFGLEVEADSPSVPRR